MKMVSMAMTAKEAKDEALESAPGGGEQPEYPYGLQISMESEQMDKLGMKDMPMTGDEMTITCKVKCTGCSETDMQGGKPERSVTLQITDMMVDQAAAEPKPIDKQATAKALYPGMDKGGM